MQFDAFLSYSRDSRDEIVKIVKSVKEELEFNYGLVVEYDTEKLNQRENIYEKCIQNSSDIICFVSREYDLSEDCIREFSYAVKLGKSLIILMFTPFENLKHIGPAITQNSHNLHTINVYEDIEKFRLLQGESYNYMIECLSVTNIRDKPIKLIYKNENTNEILINPIALKIIESIKGNIGVCVIVGPYRQGKSFLMTRLIGAKNGFKLGHTDQASTKGIWMWSTPIQLNGANVLFMDTEGLESDGSEEWDKQIFILSLLLSSYFIYNTRNTLQRQSLYALAMISNLSKKVRSSGNGNLDDFPDFIWVIRDFYLVMTTTPKEMLEKFLQLEAGNDGKTKERNEIRDEIKRSFRSLNCAYLPIPELKVPNGKTLDENLRDIEIIPWTDISENFRDGMDNLCNMIKKNVKGKRINQTNVDGSEFSRLIRHFVNALNTNKTIFLDDSLRLAKIAVTDQLIKIFFKRVPTSKWRIKTLDKLKLGLDKEAVEYHIKFCSHHYPYIPRDVWAQIFSNNNDSKNWPSILRKKQRTEEEEQIVKLYVGRWREFFLDTKLFNSIGRNLPSSLGLWRWSYYCRIFFACDFRESMQKYLGNYPDLIIEPGFVIYCEGDATDSFDEI